MNNEMNYKVMINYKVMMVWLLVSNFSRVTFDFLAMCLAVVVELERNFGHLKLEMGIVPGIRYKRIRPGMKVDFA